MRKDTINNVVATIPLLSSLALEDTLSVIMLVLGLVSFTVSILYSSIKTYHLYKQGKIEEALETLKELQDEIDRKRSGK